LAGHTITLGIPAVLLVTARSRGIEIIRWNFGLATSPGLANHGNNFVNGKTATTALIATIFSNSWIKRPSFKYWLCRLRFSFKKI